METVIVKNSPHPDRLACSACGCEIGQGRQPERNLYMPATEDHQWQATAMPRPLLSSERPGKFNPDDGCPCHDSWKLVMKGA